MLLYCRGLPLPVMCVVAFIILSVSTCLCRCSKSRAERMASCMLSRRRRKNSAVSRTGKNLPPVVYFTVNMWWLTITHIVLFLPLIRGEQICVCMCLVLRILESDPDSWICTVTCWLLSVVESFVIQLIWFHIKACWIIYSYEKLRSCYLLLLHSFQPPDFQNFLSFLMWRFSHFRCCSPPLK